MDEPDPPHPRRSFPPPKQKEPLTSQMPSAERDSLLMDLDLDSSWSFDQIFAAASNSCMASTSEQPYSPLWAFSDDANGDNVAGSTSAIEFRLADYSRKVLGKIQSC